ncbi:hypothetical protein BDA96_01G210200 [Sorghum bicolor]|uniref:Uncharacterized protein n=2 Tax=Sorghum bicolor TaxID=4558 RepID=A0A921S056_SORBI|nr:hypothetical protein BDA96_01G210200 [Sorghum bicolor]KXG38198.1 hypothetical protein SORBI_3001G197500 [Sorghum bicolor]
MTGGVSDRRRRPLGRQQPVMVPSTALQQQNKEASRDDLVVLPYWYIVRASRMYVHNISGAVVGCGALHPACVPVVYLCEAFACSILLQNVLYVPHFLAETTGSTSLVKLFF